MNRARVMWRTCLAATIAVLMLLTSLVAAETAAAEEPGPTAVSVPGSFGSEVGCPGDWQPDCAQLQMTQRSTDGIWSLTLDLPAGSFEYKAALDNSFDVNYGLGAVEGGPNIALTVPAGGAKVTFYYDPVTHWVTDDVNSLIVTAPGDFQSELGCSGDWSPDCMTSWLEDPDGDGIYTFTTTAIPVGSYNVKAAIGLSWDVNYGAGGTPGGANIGFSVSTSNEAVMFTFDSKTHVLTVLTGAGASVDLTTPTAYWLSTRDIAWALGSSAALRTYRLYYAPTGGLQVGETGVTGGSYIPLTYKAAGLPAKIRSKFPAQSGLGALRIPHRYVGLLPAILKGQVAVTAYDGDGALVDGAGLQIAGVLDAVYHGAGSRTLGVTWAANGRPTLNLWAPTAKSVQVIVYPDATSTTPVATVPLGDTGDGVWSVTGTRSWKGDYFLYDVSVYVPETGAVEHNDVTDPYSVALSTNGSRSELIDLDDASLEPSWLGQSREAGAAEAGGPIDHRTACAGLLHQRPDRAIGRSRYLQGVHRHVQQRRQASGRACESRPDHGASAADRRLRHSIGERRQIDVAIPELRPAGLALRQ